MTLRNPNKATFCSLCRHSLWWFPTHVMEQVQAIQTNMETGWEINICFGCVKYFTTVSSGACIMMPKLLDRCESLKLLFPRWQWRTISTIWGSRLLPTGFLKLVGGVVDLFWSQWAREFFFGRRVFYLWKWIQNHLNDLWTMLKNLQDLITQFSRVKVGLYWSCRELNKCQHGAQYMLKDPGKAVLPGQALSWPHCCLSLLSKIIFYLFWTCNSFLHRTLLLLQSLVSH